MSTAVPDWVERHARWVAPLFLLALVLAALSPTIWTGTEVLSSSAADARLQFLSWRRFGFDELRHGNLALWNPHVYGGAPFFGGMQSALLYPVNWIHLVLPLNVAINWEIAINAWLAGYLMYLWARTRGLSAAAAMLGGGTFIFSGTFWLHIFAGHLPHLAVMAWMPLLLMTVDRLVRGGSWRWTLVGMGGVSMQVLGGHPQYVYFSAIGLGLYTLMSLPLTRQRLRLIAAVAAIYVGAGAITAVQLWTTLDSVGESMRGGGAGFGFASHFALPPMNLVTAVTPNLMGVVHSTQSPPAYWGLSYLWEASLFLGVVPCVLAIYAVVTRLRREWWPVVGLAVVALVLAFGRYTPLYQVLYDHLPGFSGFRAVAKFAFLTCLCAAMLAAVGFDRLRSGEKRVTAWPIVLGVISFLLIGLAFAVRTSGRDPGGWWAGLVQSVGQYGHAQMDVYRYYLDDYQNADFIRNTAVQAFQSLLIAALTLAAFAGVLFATRRRPQALIAVVLIAAVEWLIFAGASAASFGGSAMAIGPTYQRALQATLPGQRVVVAEGGMNNLPMLYDRSDVWGVDPFVQKRWAEFMFTTQDKPADEASQNLHFAKVKPQMMRLAGVRFALSSREQDKVIELPPPLATAQLVSRYAVVPDRDAQLKLMADNRFDAAAVVLLEREPSIKPEVAADAGTVTVEHRSTDELELKIDAKAPAVVLVNNPYSRWWTALPSAPGPQPTYDVMPADWAMQAIPVRAGQHRILLSYRPRGFVIGRWVSAAGLLAYGVAVVIAMRRTRGGLTATGDTGIISSIHHENP